MLKFRPHHFLCTVGYLGKGYSPEFVRNYDRIAALLKASPNGDAEPIEVVGKTDSICAPCPSRRGDLCETQGKIDLLDRAHARILSLREGEILSWGEAKRRIRESFSEEAFEEACAPCSWKSLGVCKSALKELKPEESALKERKC